MVETIPILRQAGHTAKLRAMDRAIMKIMHILAMYLPRTGESLLFRLCGMASLKKSFILQGDPVSLIMRLTRYGVQTRVVQK